MGHAVFYSSPEDFEHQTHSPPIFLPWLWELHFKNMPLPGHKFSRGFYQIIQAFTKLARPKY
jgi:hypothetical protein